MTLTTCVRFLPPSFDKEKSPDTFSLFYCDWISRLQQAGQSEEADEISKRMIQAWQHRAARFPDSTSIASSLQQLQN